MSAKKMSLLDELRAEEQKLRGIRAPTADGNGAFRRATRKAALKPKAKPATPFKKRDGT